MDYTAQSPEIDEHAIVKMREWLDGEIDCPRCHVLASEVPEHELIAFVDDDYPGGVAGFLAALEAGDGDLP